MSLGLVQGRGCSLSFDSTVIFQTEIVVTSQDGWDVTPVASSLTLTGPTVLVDGDPMTVMFVVILVWKQGNEFIGRFPHPFGTSVSPGSTKRVIRLGNKRSVSFLFNLAAPSPWVGTCPPKG